jgi:ubiquinone/menaquinone biosynthesis C-methylase UbiE
MFDRPAAFEDALFDVVIVESVKVFVTDKRRAVSEYVRVTKPGGGEDLPDRGFQ